MYLSAVSLVCRLIGVDLVCSCFLTGLLPAAMGLGVFLWAARQDSFMVAHFFLTIFLWRSGGTVV